jgi:hypothetical protein
MATRSKWLIPILILSLLVMSLLPCISCTPGQALYLLIWAVKCGIEVYCDGDYQGTLEFMQEWGACVLQVLSTEGEHSLDFVIPGSVLAESASEQGIQLTASEASEIPEMTVTYNGVIAAGGRFEVNIYHPIASTTVASTARLSAEAGDKPPLLGSIVVETSSQPFEPRPLINPSISCEPSSYMAVLHPDTPCSTTMRIRNEGDVTLTYDIHDVSESVYQELMYDNGDTNRSVGWDYIGAKNAIRFTPPSYPAVLNTARICLQDSMDDSGHEQFAVEVYDDNGAGGAPGTLLGVVNTTATDWGWSDVDISPLEITITNGDFYVAYCQLTAWPDCEMLCIDTGPTHSRSLRWSYDGGVWAWRVSSDNYMIRCVAEIPEDCPWLDTSPELGSVEPGNWDEITIIIDASGLAPAEYSAEIVISNNDPDKNPITVPVTLHVISTPNSPPNIPSNPSPANHDTDVSINTDLSWTGGDPDAGDTVTYDVYFDTTGATTLVSNDQSATTYELGILNPNTQYYWKIIATDNHEALTEGPLWDFTTQAGTEPTVTWNFALGGQPLIAPNPGAGRPFLSVPASCTWITVSPGAELWGIYYLVETGPGAGMWLWYIPGLASGTLTQLEPGAYYLVVVSAPCALTIPQG